MRLNRALAVAGWALAGGGAAALGWVGISRAVVLPDVDRWVGAGLALAAVLAVAAAAAVRIPAAWAAWAADGWLDSRDRFSTAVELVGAGDAHGLAARQVALAEEAAAGIHQFPVPPRVPAKLLGGGGVAVLLALVIGMLPNPRDAARALQAAERAAVAAQADALRQAASELESPEAAPGQQALADELRRVAAQLDQASLEAALAQLGDARADLARRIDPDRSAQRTALAGLARELAANPLAAGETVQEQLDALAAQLSADPARADQALAERLEKLESALSGGSPDIAEALGQAASAVATGDAAGAARALGDASAAVGDATARLEEQDAVASADTALAGAQAALQSAAGQGQAQGQGPAPGGGGRGGGNPSGVNDGGARQGTGQAIDPRLQGTGTGSQPASDLDLQTVYDPPLRLGGDGEDVRLDSQATNDGPSSDAGRQQGQGLRNTPLVPYLDVLPSYAEEAARTVERPGYPVRLRGAVQDYFDRLGAAQG